MARTNNLTDFLTDVSNAIKQKTGDSTPIPASEFDTEILSIETAGNYQSKTLNVTQNGNYNLLPDQEFDAISNVNISVNVDTTPVLQNKTITENGSYTADSDYDGLDTVIVNVPQTGADTSDATATENDVISPNTFYAKDGKKTGAIIPVYDTETSMDLQIIGTLHNLNDINTEFGLAVLGPINSYGTITIANFDLKTGIVGSTILTLPASTYSSRTLYASCFDKNLNSNGKLNFYLMSRNNRTYYVQGFEYDVEKQEMSSEKAYFTTDTWNRLAGNMMVNPKYAGVLALGTQGGSGSSEQNMRGIILYFNGNSFSNLVQSDYQNQTTTSSYFTPEWDSDGIYCYITCGRNTTSPNQKKVFKYYPSNNSALFVRNYTNSDLVALENPYCLYNNQIRNSDTNTVVGTISGLTSNSYKWYVKPYLFEIKSGNIYAYKLDIIDMTISLITVINYSGTASGLHYSTPRCPKNGQLWFEEGGTDTLYNTIMYEEGTKLLSLVRQNIPFIRLDPSIDTEASNVLSGKKFYNANGLQSGSMPNQTDKEFEPSIENQTIPEGYYNGNIIKRVTSAIDLNIIPENIRKGATILEVEGSFEGSTGGDATSDGNLQAKYLLEGYSAVVDGKLIEGTMKEYGTRTIVPTSKDIEIPEGHYNSLSIPIINAANCEDYSNCNAAILSI